MALIVSSGRELPGRTRPAEHRGRVAKREEANGKWQMAEKLAADRNRIFFFVFF
jgi:hypothetical protein